MSRTSKIALMVGCDLLALPGCFLAAMIFRGGDLELARSVGSASYALVAVVTIAAFSVSGLYRAVIRFIDQRLLRFSGVALAFAILYVYAVFIVMAEPRFPRSALAIYWFVVFSYVVISRIGLRNLLRAHCRGMAASSDAVAIYGAGNGGACLAQAMRHGDDYRPVCFFDDKRVLDERTIFPSEHTRIMRMKESALRPSVLETCITCLMMACKTHERGSIESMVDAIVAEYVPTTPAAAPPPVAEPQAPGLIKKFVPFRI